MMNFLRKLFPERSPFRLIYHKFMGFLAAVYYGFPANHLIVVGVTGTNGKTTTVNLITNILNEAGYKVGMSSTINFQIGDKRWNNDTKQSTQGPFVLQKMLRTMVKSGVRYAVIEVTSHAIDQSRIYGVNFDVAVITNVTPDHVEYHGGFDNYINTKAALFGKVSKGKRKLGIPKVFVLNSDDQYYTVFNQFVADLKISYGLKNATVYAENVVQKPEGSKFVLHVPNAAIEVELGMPGEFNVYNALAAAAACISLQVPLEVVKKGLEESGTVPGRFEHVNAGQKFSVIVDYAHASDALENLLSLYRRLTPGRLFAVYGATGGGRDKGKRPRMGEIGNEFADVVILTDDDPYSEDEWQIIDQLALGVKREEGKGFWMIPDRREAIRLALSMAKEGDCVVVSGKGAEEVMMVRGKKIKWSDRQVITELIKQPLEVAI